MRIILALLLTLSAIPAAAETLYVTQRLETGVFAQPTLAGDRIAVTRGGDAVELLNREGESALVRLADGSEGWISAAQLDTEPPPAARLEALAEENEQLSKRARRPVQHRPRLCRAHTQPENVWRAHGARLLCGHEQPPLRSG
jgi:uncharacterized protein YgiM (DUF1202 family)